MSNLWSPSAQGSWPVRYCARCREPIAAKRVAHKSFFCSEVCKNADQRSGGSIEHHANVASVVARPASGRSKMGLYPGRNSQAVCHGSTEQREAAEARVT